MNECHNLGFQGFFIRAEILRIEELSPTEILLLSWIDSLYNEEYGGCFASNEYLARNLRIKKNTIAKLLGNLRKLGLVEDVKSARKTRVIRATIHKYIDRLQSNQGIGKKSIPHWKKIHPICASPYTYTKEERKESANPEGLDAPAPSAPSFSPSSRKKIKEEKQEVHPNVWLTLTQQENILKKCGQNKALQQKAYEKLSDWKIGKSITGGKNDYKALVDWAINSVKDENLTSTQQKVNPKKETDPEKIQERSEKAKKCINQNWDKAKSKNIYISHRGNHLAIGNDTLFFDDIKFDELIKHYLKKYGL